MRRWETYVALIAVTLASLSALRLTGHYRIPMALAAIGLIAWVGLSRLRTLRIGGPRRDFGSLDRAARIREERERRYGR